MYSNNELKDALRKLSESGIATDTTIRHINIGTERYLSIFAEEVLNGIVSNGGSTCRFYEGEWGSGKSHIARSIADRALSENFAVAHLDLTNDDISFEKWPLVVKQILINVKTVIDGSTYTGIPEIAEYFSNTAEYRNVLKTLSVAHSSYLRAAQSLSGNLHSKARDLLHDYLSGNTVYAYQFKEVGIHGVTKNLTANNAESILRTATTILKALGLSGTLIVFDENEHTFEYKGQSPPRRVIQSSNRLRRLIDSCFNSQMIATAIVFTALPGFFTSCSNVYPALGQRLRPTESKIPVSWRWPALTVDQVFDISSSEDFVDQLVSEMAKIMDIFGIRNQNVIDRMRKSGNEIIVRDAGTGYKRELVKTLSEITLHELTNN